MVLFLPSLKLVSGSLHDLVVWRELELLWLSFQLFLSVVQVLEAQKCHLSVVVFLLWQLVGQWSFVGRHFDRKIVMDDLVQKIVMDDLLSLCREKRKEVGRKRGNTFRMMMMTLLGWLQSVWWKQLLSIALPFSSLVGVNLSPNWQQLCPTISPSIHDSRFNPSMTEQVSQSDPLTHLKSVSKRICGLFSLSQVFVSPIYFDTFNPL